MFLSARVAAELLVIRHVLAVVRSHLMASLSVDVILPVAAGSGDFDEFWISLKAFAGAEVAPQRASSRTSTSSGLCLY